VMNAADAMRNVHGQQRKLEIKSSLADPCDVVLSVRDVGVGIKPEDHERLFHPFYTTKKNGMGIGLSISQSIVEGHHGRIWAAPNDDGTGSIFSFSIPCEERHRVPNNATSVDSNLGNPKLSEGI